MNNYTYEDNPKTVPYSAYEGLQVRHERTVKRLIIAIIVTAILMFASNMAWLYAWQSYDYESEEVIVSQDTKDGGNANFIGNNGDINNGKASGDYKAAKTP